ncbi:MAG: zinc-ribbon domain-containing protein [Acidaminococcaceae bacterium]|nr:zinc-ribbon domain-containing protein [Acidaminococcaceae bacterium]
MKRCDKCGKQYDTDAKFCTYCGGELESIAQDLFCVKCGKKLAAGSKFCVFCGEPVTKTVTAVNSIKLMQKITPPKALQKIPFHLLNKKIALSVVAVFIIVLGGTVYHFLFSNSIPGPEIENDVKMPATISKIDRTKTTPVFDKNFEKIVNYRRKTIAGPAYISTLKPPLKVFDKPDGKVTGELALGTACEVSDFKDTKSGTWLFLRLIQIKNGKTQTPLNGWIREDGAFRNHNNSVFYKFTENGITKPPGNYRFLYNVSGCGNTYGDYSYLKNLNYKKQQSVFIDLDSIKMDETNSNILFACLTMPDKEIKYYRYSLKTFDITDASFPELPPLPDGKILIHKWVKDKNGIYYDTFRNEIISPPGNLIHNGFIRILEGK